ncbi:MAG: hypothetical protein OXU33_07420 [Gemmatimonadota bacterium]|nr:hypothetical protein [Gemmatimonadota bacterium]MDE3006190.1 hypothetical protein [Gemmatimonadota bacterium]MDE3013887.1 hypothetical protein [Gemmatimonadota bacterium]
MIVSSILLAFGIDAGWDRMQRSIDERESLALVRRDLQAAVEQLDEFIVFSAGASRAALRAYSALSAPGPYDQDAIHTDLLRIERRTVRLPTAAYTDLLSTGALRVIRDREIRDAIVRFYEMAERWQVIIEKNNSVYIDGLAWDSFYRDGLVYSHRTGTMGLELLDLARDSVRARLGPDFVHPEDVLWSLGPDSREWAQLQSRLVIVGSTLALGELIADELIREARALEALIQSSL